MKDYSVKNLRNVVLLGRGGDGKTTLAEAMLYLAKATDRFGKVPEGNTVCDYDAEEIKRKISISTSIAPFEWNDVKINILDTPGYLDFIGEVIQSITAADASIIAVTGKSGVHAGAEKAFKMSKDKGISKSFFVSKLDEENADFFKVYNQLKDKFGSSVAALTLPIVENGKVKGYVDVVSGQGFSYDKEGNKSEIDVPEDLKTQRDEIKYFIDELIAVTDEALLDEFLNGVEFTHEEFEVGLRRAIADGSLTPVFCGSSVNFGNISFILDFISEYFPSPDQMNEKIAENNKGEQIKVTPNENEPLSIFIFKTVADPFVGKLSYFRVMSGKMVPDVSLYNATTDETEKIGKIYVVKGKKQTETKLLIAGDIGAVTKLEANTGDTLSEIGKTLKFSGFDFPRPSLSMAIYPKAKGDEEKISTGLHRLIEEDPTIKFEINKETHQQILSGQGEVHLDVIISKLKSKFGTAVDLVVPKVAYREAIKSKVKVQGKHKKQSGGHGQFGDVWIEFEPTDSLELVFEEKIFGGAVPKNFFPAVEKGLKECVAKGVLAGYPVVNLKATLVDGSYHPVDSSEMSFKMAAAIAYKAGLEKANPVLLEPIGNLKVYIPDDLMGDVIGDINKRRGRVLGMNPAEDGISEVEAEVPMAEMHDYSVTLRSLGHSRGSFILEFERYEEAPMNVAKKVIEASKSNE